MIGRYAHRVSGAGTNYNGDGARNYLNAHCRPVKSTHRGLTGNRVAGVWCVAARANEKPPAFAPGAGLAVGMIARGNCCGHVRPGGLIAASGRGCPQQPA